MQRTSEKCVVSGIFAGKGCPVEGADLSSKKSCLAVRNARPDSLSQQRSKKDSRFPSFAIRL